MPTRSAWAAPVMDEPATLATRWLSLSPSALQPCRGSGEGPRLSHTGDEDVGVGSVRGRLGSFGTGAAGGG
jgi:hypothetical protein